MQSKSTFSFPGLASLQSQLEKMVNRVHSPFLMKEVVKRKAFDYHSTSPAEIITCRLNNGQLIHLFCKYSGSHTQFSNGHRGGVEYEGKVYKKILDTVSLNSPRFYGFYKEKNKTCLVIGYLKEAALLKDNHDPVNFAKAASWIGKLHQNYIVNSVSAVKPYDFAYYNIWLKAVEKIAVSLNRKHPWLNGVCDWFRQNIHLLTDSEQTFIHGEYYTKNILVQKGIIYPIDWESSAIGPGEIDLASLIEGWDYKRRRAAIKAYIATRWPDRNFAEDAFRERLLMAKIYFFLRWTGEYDDPDCWIERAGWFRNFYQDIKKSGYKKALAV